MYTFERATLALLEIKFQRWTWNIKKLRTTDLPRLSWNFGSREREQEHGVALGGALWRCFCQSIRSFEGRRIFEMGIRVRRRAEKSSSSAAAVAATGMGGQRGWKGRNERTAVESWGWARSQTEVAKRVDSALDQGPLSLAAREREKTPGHGARVDVEGCNAGWSRRKTEDGKAGEGEWERIESESESGCRAEPKGVRC